MLAVCHRRRLRWCFEPIDLFGARYRSGQSAKRPAYSGAQESANPCFLASGPAEESAKPTEAPATSSLLAGWIIPLGKSEDGAGGGPY